MKNNSLLQNQKGQGMVEFILLAAIMVSGTLFIVNKMKSDQLAQKLLGNPWTSLSGMIECGSWSGCKQGQHPANSERKNSYKPDS